MSDSSSMVMSASPCYPRSRYPDFNASDDIILLNLCNSRANKRINDKAYRTAIKQAINKLNELEKALGSNAVSIEEKLCIMARMESYQIVLRENNVPLSMIKTINGSVMPRANCPANLDGIYTGILEVSPSNLEHMKKDKIASELSLYLGIRKAPGQSYMDYLKANVRDMIFLPRLKDYFKKFVDDIFLKVQDKLCGTLPFLRRFLTSSDDWAGTVEELSRTIIIDTYNERHKIPREIWQVASLMVHETAHIEYFHDPMNANDPAKYQHGPYEMFACKTELAFLNNLLRCNMNFTGGISLTADQINGVKRDIEFLEKQIVELPSKL